MKQPIFLPLLVLLFLSACADYEAPEMPPRTLQEAVYIDRTDEGTKLQIHTAGAYELYAMTPTGTMGSQIEMEENHIIPVNPVLRPQFYVIQEGDTFIIRERHIPVEGSPNIREVGGLFTQDGYQVKWGQVYRSGATAEIPEEEFPILETMALKTICDFRTPAEREDEPDNWPAIDQIKLVFNTVGDTNLMQQDWLTEIKKDDFQADQMLIEGNRTFIKDGLPAYRRFFELLLAEENYPLLYHCSAGKDRAGFATVSLLMALGVDSTLAVQDYLMSNYYRFGTTEAQLKKAANFLGVEPEKIRPLMNVKPSYIQAAFETANAEYGSFDAYLCEGLGVCETEREKLRSMLLYNYPMEMIMSDSLSVLSSDMSKP